MFYVLDVEHIFILREHDIKNCKQKSEDSYLKIQTSRKAFC